MFHQDSVHIRVHIEAFCVRHVLTRLTTTDIKHFGPLPSISQTFIPYQTNA